MDYAEANNKPAENSTYPQASPAYMRTQKPKSDEPITQIQRDTVITPEKLPTPFSRLLATLILLSPFIFVASMYYGWINP